jgi:hypothetical protein
MTRVDFESAFDGAECVQVKQIGGYEHIQVWYGGTTVRVFTAYRAGSRCNLQEQTVWSISDEEGRPVEQEEIEARMQEEFERVEERVGGEF